MTRCPSCSKRLRVSPDGDAEFAIYLHQLSPDCTARVKPPKLKIKVKKQWEDTSYE